MATAQPKTFRIAFKEAVCKYLNTTVPIETDRARYALMSIVEETTEPDARQQIKEVLAEFSALPLWLESHFTPGTNYVHRGCVYGWHFDEQLQAESLPVKVSTNPGKGVLRKMEVTHNRGRFRVADKSPPIENGIVCVPEFQTNQYAPWGWANALPLQWHRSNDGYIVDRAIIALEFWPAWKWWPGAGEYYAINPPSPMVTMPNYVELPAVDFWEDF